ncbi:aminotransferase class IV [Clostridium vincentii]|uniref:Aminodeoxychorismate lyase n=1 Tax=Clostridium vincentii TaxID=52704 RepID=A0A2T0BHN7_9CLOT|nr:aminotransferase class IV [Clostridium vincentii]PRR83406.1 Aminodeoxychorismate lyase [Clostridium vincentii]
MRKIIYREDNILLDEGSFFGKGVFETILWLKKPVFLEEHITRLKIGMEVLGLENLEEEKLLEFLSKLSIENKGVKIMITPLNIVITTRNIPYGEEVYKEGMNLNISKVLRNSTSALSYIKSTCYIENILEKAKANKNGADDMLFLNEKGYITETSCSNIFLIKNHGILTPRRENGLLSGIIRKWIIENFKVQETDITLNDLKEADEVFITNSLMGIMKIKQIDDFTYNDEIGVVDIKHKYDATKLKIGG